MPKTNERTLKMMENYIKLHNEGHSVKEIAKMFNLSPFTIYDRLGEIAEQNGVTRESLLERVFIADHSGQNYTPVKPIDPTEFRKHFDAALTGVQTLKATISQALEEYDINDELLKEEIKQ